MGKQIKIGVFILLLFAGVSLAAFAQVTDLNGLQDSLADFSDEAARALPFNASLGLNWADAYIGRIFPGIPPHMGFGATAGFTTMKLPAIKSLARHLGYHIEAGSERLFYPSYTIETRIGGILVPMDIGVKFGYLPYADIMNNDTEVSSLLAGGDIRFAILDGKANRASPNISLGLGLNYIKGGLKGESRTSSSISLGGNTIRLEDPAVNITWDSFSLDLKAQISKTFLILTPYLGIGGSYAWTNTGYDLGARVTVNGEPVSQVWTDTIQALLDLSGLGNVNIGRSGISSEVDKNALNLRLFGGFSVNLFVFKLELTGLYSILDGNYGGSLAFRFQL